MAGLNGTRSAISGDILTEVRNHPNELSPRTVVQRVTSSHGAAPGVAEEALRVLIDSGAISANNEMKLYPKG
jgi:hypothetical protein